MFHSAVSELAQFVAAHGRIRGCCASELIDVMHERLFPVAGLEPNDTLTVTMLEMLHTTSSSGSPVPDVEVEMRDTSVNSGVPKNWPELCAKDANLARRIWFIPTRSLQGRVLLGNDPQVLSSMTKSMWLLTDLISQRLVEGITRDDLRQQFNAVSQEPSTYHASVLRMLSRVIIIDTPVVHEGRMFAKRLFIAVAAMETPASTSPSGDQSLLAWFLSRQRAQLRCQFAVPMAGESELVTASQDGSTNDAEERQRKKKRVDSQFWMPELTAESSGDPKASLSSGNRVNDSILAEIKSIPTVLSSEYLLRPTVIPVVLQLFGGRMPTRRLTQVLLHMYGCSLAVPRLVLNSSITCVSSVCESTPDLVVDSDRVLLAKASSNEVDGGSDDGGEDAFPIFPLVDYVPQLIEAIVTQQSLPHISVEQLRPSVVSYHLKMLPDAVRVGIKGWNALNQNQRQDEFVTCPALEVTMRPVKGTKSFGLAVRRIEQQQPQQQEAAAASERGANGVTTWAREHLTGILAASPHGAVVLDDLIKELDRKTLNRLLHVMVSEGRIHTTSVFCRGRRPLGIVLDAGKFPEKAAFADSTKQELAREYYARADAETQERRRIKRLRDGEKADSSQALVAAAAKPEPQSGAVRKELDFSEAPNIKLHREKAPSDVTKLRSFASAMRNGAVPSATAKCWRLHIQLWEIMLRKQLFQSTLEMDIHTILSEMTLSTFCVVVGIQTEDLVPFFIHLPHAHGIPWGTPMHRLPVMLRKELSYHSMHPLIALIGMLQYKGVVTTDIPPEVISGRLPHKGVSAQWRLTLIPSVSAPDGQTWTFFAGCETADTADVANDVFLRVGEFWATHDTTLGPFTPLPLMKQKHLVGTIKQMLAACKKDTDPVKALPTLAELYVLQKVAHQRLAPLLSLCWIARGDLTQFVRRSNQWGQGGTARVTPLLDGATQGTAGTTLTQRKRRVPLQHHPAFRALMRAVVRKRHRVDDECDDDDAARAESGSDTDDAWDEDAFEASGRKNRVGYQHRSLRGHSEWTAEHNVTFVEALRIALRDHLQHIQVLRRFETYVCRTSPHHLRLVRNVRTLLERFPEISACIPEGCEMEATEARLKCLESVLYPAAGTTLPTASVSVVSNPPQIPSKEETSLGPVMDAIRCCLWSAPSHFTSEGRDALFSGVTPESIVSASSLMQRTFPLMFRASCEGRISNPRFGTASSQQLQQLWEHTSERIHKVVATRSGSLTHLPRRYGCDALATSVLIRHAISSMNRHVSSAGSQRPDVASSSYTVNSESVLRQIDNELLEEPEPKLVRQPCAPLEATPETNGSDDILIPFIKYPLGWMNSFKAREALASACEVNTTKNQQLASTAALGLWTLAGNQLLGASLPAFRETEERLSSDGIMGPSASSDDALQLRGTPLCHVDGSLNAFVCASEAARARELLLASPGLEQSFALQQLAADGLVSESCAAWIVKRLIANRCVVTRELHAWAGSSEGDRIACPLFSNSSATSSHAVGKVVVTLWWNTSEFPESVVMHPMFCLFPPPLSRQRQMTLDETLYLTS